MASTAGRVAATATMLREGLGRKQQRYRGHNCE
jgi:hypothetical protein